jgi:hypothetical protein
MSTLEKIDRALVGMETLQEIIETVLFTPAIHDCVPISIILVGPPGTGKSKIILQFSAPSLLKTNDVTSAGLADIVGDDKENKVRHVIIPDFNIVVSHKAATSNLTISSLLTLMSEGILRIDDGRRKKELIHAPLGIITAMTREIYEEHATRFRKLGIGRRFVPLFFGYSLPTREKIQSSIKNGNTTLKQLQEKKIMLPKREAWPLKADFPTALAEKVATYSLSMAEALSYQPDWIRDNETFAWKIQPVHGRPPMEFTPHMVLRAMAQAHAIRAGRKVVKETEMEFLMRFISFMNYSLPVQL